MSLDLDNFVIIINICQAVSVPSPSTQLISRASELYFLMFNIDDCPVHRPG